MEQERFERVDLGGAFGHRVEIRERKGEVSIVELDQYSTGLAMRVPTANAQEIAKAIYKITGADQNSVPMIRAVTTLHEAMDATETYMCLQDNVAREGEVAMVGQEFVLLTDQYGDRGSFTVVRGYVDDVLRLSDAVAHPKGERVTFYNWSPKAVIELERAGVVVPAENPGPSTQTRSTPAPPPIPAQMGGNPVLARLDPTSLVAIATVVRDAIDERTFDLTAGLVASVLEEIGCKNVALYSDPPGVTTSHSPREFGSWLVEEFERRVALEKAQEQDGD